MMRPIDYLTQPDELWHWLRGWRWHLMDAQSWLFDPRMTFHDYAYPPSDPDEYEWSRWDQLRLTVWWSLDPRYWWARIQDWRVTQNVGGKT